MKCKHEGCTNEAQSGLQCHPCRGYIVRYGMNKPQVQELLDSQDGCCALCRKSVTLGRYDGVVDHCHTTNKVRGILCHECNVVIGYIENTFDTTDEIVSYLSS